MDQLDVIRRKIRETLGFEPKDLIPDGKVKRFSLDAANEYDDKGWYVLWENKAADGINLGCVFGDWRNKDARYKCFPNGGEQNRDEKLRQHIERQRIDAQQKRLMEHELAAQISADKWAKLPDDFVVTPYMKKKHIFQRFGCKTLDDVLYVPMRDITGKLWSIQRILSDAKLYTTNGRVQETFHVISSEKPKIGPIYLCEGFATGVSIHLATERVVVVTFDSGNLPRIAKIFRDQNPYRHMVICGDEDRWDKKTGELRKDNPGRRAAEQAGKIANCEVIFPVFDEEDKLSTDFNDLHVRGGLGIVRDQLEKRKRAVPDKETAQTKPIPQKGEAMTLSIVPGENDQAEIKPSRNKPGRPKKNDAPQDAPQGAPPLRLSAGQIEYDLGMVLDRVPPMTCGLPLNQVPLFPQRFEVFRGNRIDEVCVVEVIDNTAHLSTAENLSSDLSKFINMQSFACTVYKVGIQKVRNAVKSWAYQSRELKDIPPPWGFKSDPKLCFNRLPYDPIVLDNDDDLAKFAPRFAELSSRIENVFAFYAFIGSIFFPMASRKQILWLWGPSGGGKSQLGVLNEALLGTASLSLENDDFEDSFWKSDLIDKRTLYIDEADPDFLQKTFFKALTGSNRKRINQKYLKAFGAQINTITMASSNYACLIPDDAALIGRVVPCYVRPLAINQKIPEQQLKIELEKEAPYIAGFCMKIYRQHCPNFEAIRFDKEKHLQEAIDSYESDFLDIVEDRFVIGPEYWIGTAELNQELSYGQIFSKIDRDKFKAFLKNRFPGVKEDRHGRVFKESASPRARGWVGICRKPTTYYQS